MNKWEHNLKIYDDLVSQCERFGRKGKTSPYTSANGYMFSFINKDGDIGIRFSESVQEEYLASLKTTLFKSHNSIMKGYILIPVDLLDNDERMIEMLNESFDFVMSLPTK